MRKAGIKVGVEEAEKVMDELESQLRQSSELTTVLAAPLSNDSMMMMDTDLTTDDTAELDAELGLLSEFTQKEATAGVLESTRQDQEQEEDNDSAVLLPSAPPSTSSSSHHRRTQSISVSKGLSLERDGVATSSTKSMMMLSES